MAYYLMNKDVICTTFDKIGNNWTITGKVDTLPLGQFEINRWLEDRKAYKHNKHLKKLMIDCGCETVEGFIKITHAASINDTYWVKSETESVTWNDVSFYRNEFNDIVSKLAFEGLGLYGIQMGTTSPELTTDGTFRKCWRKEDDGIYLYKRGTTGAINAGLEPYCESMASELIHVVDPTNVMYETTTLRGKLASRCAAFTNEDIGFVPLKRMIESWSTLHELLDFFDLIDDVDKFRLMLVMDAVVFNTDRHFGNLGIRVENDTQTPLGIAPNFDLNLALLPYVTMDEFKHIGTRLLSYSPFIGNDFTRLGQKMLTPKIRSELINLKGFKFSFRGNKVFPELRVKILEAMIDRQISAILANGKLYTTDVFVPESQPEPVSIDNTKERAVAATYASKLKDTGLFTSVLVGDDESARVRIVATIKSGDQYIDIIIQMRDMSMYCEVDGTAASVEEVSNKHVGFANAYEQVCRIVDAME